MADFVNHVYMCCACVLTVHFLKEILGSIRYLHALKLGLGVCSGLVPIYCNCYDKYLYTHAEQASNIKCSQIHFKIKHLLLVNMANMHEQLEPVARCALGSFPPTLQILNLGFLLKNFSTPVNTPVVQASL